MFWVQWREPLRRQYPQRYSFVPEAAVAHRASYGPLHRCGHSALISGPIDFLKVAGSLRRVLSFDVDFEVLSIGTFMHTHVSRLGLHLSISSIMRNF